MSSIYQRGRVWWYGDYATDTPDQRYRVSLHTADKRIAKYRKSKLDEQRALGRRQPVSDLLFRQAFALYLSRTAERKGPQQRLTLWNENVDFSYTDVIAPHTLKINS